MTQRRNPPMGQLGDTDLRLLRIYRKVVECGGFSAAEVALGISRAAISMAMNDLETRLGLRLCQRGRSGFAMTDEGTEVYESTLQLLAAVEGFRTRVNGLHAQLKGELNIGITDNLVTMPQMHITDALHLPGQGDPHHARHRRRHAGQVQGDLHGGAGGERHRVLNLRSIPVPAWSAPRDSSPALGWAVRPCA